MFTSSVIFTIRSSYAFRLLSSLSGSPSTTGALLAVDTKIKDHYGLIAVHESTLFERLQAAVSLLRTSSNRRVTADDLHEFDELHVGGAEATRRLIENLRKNRAMIKDVLDLGCGLGGPTRAIANAFECNCWGIDLTPDMVSCAELLTAELGENHKGSLSFFPGSILNLPFFCEANSFDVATLIHVGMNIKQKSVLFSEAFHVLRPGGIFAVYDIMIMNSQKAAASNEILYPLPWASDADHSFLETCDAYVSSAEEAGFTTVSTENRGELAKSFFQKQEEKRKKQNHHDGRPRPLFPMSLVMGETAKDKVTNLRKLIDSNIVEPIEIIFKKP
jgi:ubiquinone/menaquinone biosynthesis C-methylase UbiE